MDIFVSCKQVAHEIDYPQPFENIAICYCAASYIIIFIVCNSDMTKTAIVVAILNVSLQPLSDWNGRLTNK